MTQLVSYSVKSANNTMSRTLDAYIVQMGSVLLGCFLSTFNALYKLVEIINLHVIILRTLQDYG